MGETCLRPRPRTANALLAELGPPVDPDSPVRLEIPAPALHDGELETTSLYVDNFGNIALNLTRDDVERIGIVPIPRGASTSLANRSTRSPPGRSPTRERGR